VLAQCGGVAVVDAQMVGAELQREAHRRPLGRGERRVRTVSVEQQRDRRDQGLVHALGDGSRMASREAHTAACGVGDREPDQLRDASPEMVLHPRRHVRGVVRLEQRLGVRHHPHEFGEPRAARSLRLFGLLPHGGRKLLGGQGRHELRHRGSLGA